MSRQFPKYDSYVIKSFHRSMAMYRENGAKARYEKCKHNYLKYLKSFEEDMISQEKFYWKEYYENLSDQQPLPLPKISKQKCLFITINFDNKNIKSSNYFTKILTKILSWNCIEKAQAAFEFRNEKEEEFYGCHLHIICQGKTKYIKQNAKRFKGKFTPLCSQYHTLLEYPIAYYDDKVKYISGETYDEEKNEHKKFDELYRKKFNMESLYKK